MNRLKNIRVLIALSALGLGVFIFQDFCCAQAIPPSDPLNEVYSSSYEAGGMDTQGHFMGGTELMNLVPFEGKLYAGVGYWMDNPRYFPNSPDPDSGAQILVLDAKASHWRQEHLFTQRAPSGGFKFKRIDSMGTLEFHYDGSGKKLAAPVKLLVVGLTGPGRAGGFFVQKSPGVWEDSGFPADSAVRSFVVHYDPVAKLEKVYAGAGGDNVEKLNGVIYSAVFDSSSPGQLRWNATAEFTGFKGRVMSMSDCEGQLYFSGKPAIHHQDPSTGAWTPLYNYAYTNPFNRGKYTSGFRGLTCIAEPGHPNAPALLTAFEGSPGEIMRIDPTTGRAVTELQISDFFTSLLSRPPAGKDFLAAYNDMPLVQSGADVFHLLGLLLKTDIPTRADSAWLLSRQETAKGEIKYQAHEVKPLPFQYRRSDSRLLSIRAIALSPFPEDQGKVVYIGGYDGHFQPDHNTAWLYRVGLNTLLTPFK